MAIPENIAAALAGNTEVLAYIQSLDEKAGRLTPEIEAELPKLGEFKAHSAALAKIIATTQAKDPDALLTDFANLKAVNADLVKQKDTWKAGGKGTETPEYRQLLEQIEANKTETKAIQDELRKAREETTSATVAKRETDLRSSVIAAGAKGKARNAEDDFLLLKAKGLIGHKEDGAPYFNKLNEKGEKVAVGSAEELMTWYLAMDPSRVGASGKPGSGADHRGGGAEGAVTVSNRAEARAAYAASRAAKI